MKLVRARFVLVVSGHPPNPASPPAGAASYPKTGLPRAIVLEKKFERSHKDTPKIHFPVATHQTHRGIAPQDERLFAARQLPALRVAAADLCWLLDRGYASRSAVELVGNRHNLTSRQRMAVSRHACALEDVQRRQKLCVEPGRLQGCELWLDGYNVLTVLESALAGGIVLLCRDGCCRDIAGIHRRYRKINETIPVLRLIGETAAALGASRCR
jgi:hypothetical protein